MTPVSPTSFRPGADAGDAHDGRRDRVVGVALTAVLSPAMAVRGAVGLVRQGRVFDEHVRVGRHGRPVTIRSFAGDAPGRRLAYLLSVASGDLRFFGPRPLHPRDVAARRSRDPDLTPGLMSAHRLRARTGIAYEGSEAPQTDLTTLQGAGLVVRYAVAELLGGGGRPAPPRLTVLGVEVTNTSMDEAVDWVVDRARDERPALLAFVNPDCLNKAVTNSAYRSVLGRAARVLPDGIGIKMAARFQGVDVRENVNGTDMFPRLCERAAIEGLSLYLLGARPGVAAAAAEEMRRRFPGLSMVGTRDGYFDTDAEPAVIEEIRTSGADILMVALGVPRQEFWLDEHLESLGVGVAMGVGGLFDFYSGRIPRAPGWLREMGLEWIWRLTQEPGRMWRRYVVGNPVFLARAWWEARRRGGIGDSERPPLLGYGYYGDEPATLDAVLADPGVSDDVVSAPADSTAPGSPEAEGSAPAGAEEDRPADPRDRPAGAVVTGGRDPSARTAPRSKGTRASRPRRVRR